MTGQFDVIIIGAGAAGLMCALTAGRRGRRVLVIERSNRAGKKILMSGGGRCNFTNTGAGPENFLSANPHFCKSALARFTPWQFIERVEQHGIAYHEKELGQLFCDDSSRQIVDMLLTDCADAGVRILTSCTIDSVRAPTGQPGEFLAETSHGSFSADAMVVASGGLSIPRMGATGFGFELARRFGHRVLPTRAGLVPLVLSGKPLEDLADLSGVALPVIAHSKGQHFHNQMLITHRGVSGPAVLQISSYWQPGDPLQLNLLPGIDALALLEDRQHARPASELKSVLSELLPKRFAQRLCERWLGNRPMRQIGPAELKRIAEQLGHWQLTASGTEGYRTAEVTLGGVDTTQLSSQTMESRRVPRLYFIGEVVDVTGWLGGYNFQWAWASGFAAGESV
jgi:predicted Rossmann fold flavoprotein